MGQIVDVDALWVIRAAISIHVSSVDVFQLVGLVSTLVLKGGECWYGVSVSNLRLASVRTNQLVVDVSSSNKLQKQPTTGRFANSETVPFHHLVFAVNVDF
jgi:hypothetical protein